MTTYSYAEVERALARLHGDNDFARARVFNRLKHFVRLGLTPEKPGKGRHISYTFNDVAKYALALALGEFGSDPSVYTQAVIELWPIAAPNVLRGSAVHLVMKPDLLAPVIRWTADAVIVDEAEVHAIIGAGDHLMVIHLGGLYERLRDALYLSSVAQQDRKAQDRAWSGRLGITRQ